MTEQIKSAIVILEAEIKHHPEYSIMGEALDTAIHSLNAWEEVLNALEEERGYLGNTLYQRKAYEKAIDIVNQHLAEIK